MKNILLSSLAGAAVLFVWGMISWMALPWHNSTIHTFDDEGAMADIMQNATPESGIYYLPGKTMGGDFTDEEVAASKELLNDGPKIFVSMKKESCGCTMGPSMAMNFAVHFFSALAAVLILRCGHIERFACRWRAVILVGIIIGLQANIPAMIWWYFPADFTLIGLADHIIGWSLAGFVIAKLVK